MLLIVILIITIPIFIKKKENDTLKLTCTYEHVNHTITQQLTQRHKEWNIKIKYTHVSNNMDDAVNRFDVYKKYLEILESNLKIQTNIIQDEYTVIYEISGNLSDFKDDSMVPSEIVKIVKYQSIDEFKKYYKESNYKCS